MMRRQLARPWTTFIAGALVASCALALWSVAWSPPTALAQVPDSGAQRAEMLREQRTTNQKLEEIAGLLREIRDQQKPGDGRRPTPPIAKP